MEPELQTRTARHPGTCRRGPHPFPAGTQILPEGPSEWACLDCVVNEIQPPEQVSDEDLLEHAHETIRSICRAAGGPDPDVAIEDVRRLAASGNQVLNAGRGRG